MRLAIVHERFTELGGSELVVEQMHRIWPEAPIYAAVVDRAALPAGLRDADLRPSRLQRHYRGGASYEHLLPRLPGAFRHLDLSAFDAVLTSHHAFANRVRPPRGVPVVSFTYTPARWIWDHRFRRGERYGVLGAAMLSAFASTQRRADRRAARRLHALAVDSRAVAERVRRWWRRDDAVVIPPPADLTWFTFDPTIPREDFYLVAGRLVPYKRAIAAVEAARRSGARLVVVGDGRERDAVEAAAAGARSIEVRGRVTAEELRDLYQRCRALLFPGEEDYGIVPVEAQACGAPVIGRRAGGILDTVVNGTTGVLYDAFGDGVDELAAVIADFDPSGFHPADVRAHAEQFSAERFRSELEAFVVDALSPSSPCASW